LNRIFVFVKTAVSFIHKVVGGTFQIPPPLFTKISTCLVFVFLKNYF